MEIGKTLSYRQWKRKQWCLRTNVLTWKSSVCQDGDAEEDEADDDSHHVFPKQKQYSSLKSTQTSCFYLPPLPTLLQHCKAVWSTEDQV